MASFTRESKFRHSVVTVSKREFQYENLKAQQPQNDIDGVAGNSKFFAYIDSNGSNSCLGILPLTSIGKNHIPVSSPAYQQPIIRAHSQAIQDFELNPFNVNQVVTCAADKLIKLWTVPTDGLTVDMTSPVLSFGMKASCPVKSISFHKSVEGLLACRGSRDISLVDVSTGSELFSVASSAFLGDLLSMSWSFLGDLLVTTAKDKSLKLIDFRANGTVSASTTGHAGIRFSRSTWLGNTPYLLTAGHNAIQEREFLLWDSRNMSTFVKRERIDNSTGSIIPLYDPDNSLLVLAGKGDSCVRMYEFAELTAGAESEPAAAVYALSNNPVGEVIRGAALLPKQCNDLMGCEVLRLLKLTDNCIQPVSVTVPRKEKLKYQSDLFPPTYSEAPAATTKEEWLSGANVTPNTVVLAEPVGKLPGGGDSSSNLVLDTSRASPVPDASEPSTPNDSGFASRRASSRIASGLGSLLKFRHMYGTEFSKDSTFYNLSPDLAPDNPIIACSDTYFALPYRGGGGPVYVSKLTNYGKVMPDCAVINGHKAPVQDISFSPFHSGLMATASADCTVKIWDLDSHDQMCSDSGVSNGFYAKLPELEPLSVLTQHTNSLRTCTFHPTVPYLLTTTSQDMTLRLFDVNAGAEVSCMNIYNHYSEHSQVVNVSYNFDGTLLSVASKDRIVRIIDPRSGKVIGQTESSQALTSTSRAIGRNLRVEWCNMKRGYDPIATVSAGNSGLRQIHLWDPRNLETPLHTKMMDNASGQLFPMFDESLSTLFVAGKGDTILRSYEIMSMNDVAAAATTPMGSATAGRSSPFPEKETSDPSSDSTDTAMGALFFEKSTEYQSGREPIAGICLLPKRVLDVRNIEVARILKLTSDTVQPIRFNVPRADHLKTYFHDDIFPPVRSKQSEVTISDWTNPDFPTSLLAPVMESLKPDDMTNISEKPVEAAPSTQKSKIEAFRNEISKKEEENRIKEDNFAKLQKLAEQNAAYNVNRSGPMKIGGVIVTNSQLAADDEVDSDDNWDD